MKLPGPVQRLRQRLAELPSIGPRQALRLVFYLIGKGANNSRALGQDLDALSKIKICERCFFIHQNSDNLCDICHDPERNHGVIMVVEKETDLLSIENTRKFNGRYLILGTISKTGLLEEWQKLRLQNMKSFIEKKIVGAGEIKAGSTSSPQADEIILGYNPSTTGDFHAGLVAKELAGFAKKISRLGRGLPTGGEIEFADDDTLGASLERRG